MTFCDDLQLFAKNYCNDLQQDLTWPANRPKLIAFLAHEDGSPFAFKKPNNIIDRKMKETRKYVGYQKRRYDKNYNIAAKFPEFATQSLRSREEHKLAIEEFSRTLTFDENETVSICNDEEAKIIVHNIIASCRKDMTRIPLEEMMHSTNSNYRRNGESVNRYRKV